MGRISVRTPLTSGSSRPSARTHSQGIPAPAKPLPPGTSRMVLANPADAKANLAIGISHAVSAMFGLREEI